MVIRDDTVPDAKTYRSKLYHIYADPSVRDDLNYKAEGHEPLPDLVINGYYPGRFGDSCLYAAAATRFPAEKSTYECHRVCSSQMYQ